MGGRTVEELADLVGRHAVGDGEHATAVEALTLFRYSAPTEPVQVVQEPSLCLIARGRKRVTLADEIYVYDPAHFLLASVDLPVAGQVIEATPRAPYLGLRVGLDPGQVGELLADCGPAEPGVRPTGRGLAVCPVGPTLMDAVARLLQLLDSPRDVAALAPLVLREITYRLLSGEQGPRLRQLAAVDGQARRIARAVRWLKGHFAEPFRIESLAREARMSPSALHRQFKAVTAMSPLQYQKQLRLQEARRLMLGEGLDAASAGFRVGYESPSQFSREYRRLFGRPPRRDLDSLRAAPSPH